MILSRISKLFTRTSIGLLLIGLAAVTLYKFPQTASAQATRSIIFPVIGADYFTNDYYVPRPNGVHGATDIYGKKMQPLVAAVDGVVSFVPYPQPSYGYDVEITDSEGYTYIYLHINDDTPGTNDGNGGAMYAYAPDMKVGNPVVKGQLLGWLGDSGRSGGVPHLHFEIIAPDGTQLNPYYSLINAPRIPTPSLYPPLPTEILPYWVQFKGGLNIAMCNFDADEESEILTGAGTGGGPHVKVFESDKTFMGKEFFAYDPAFRGGIDVACGDFTGDDIDEIVTAPGPGGGPHVKIFTLDGVQLNSYFAYDPVFRGGLRIAAGDIDGDDIAEVITGAGPGGGPHVKAFELATGPEIRSFFAYDPGFKGGVDVTAGDVTGTSAAEIITGAGPGGGAHVRIFDETGVESSGFFAYETSFTGGVKVSAGNVRPDSDEAEIVTVPASLGGPRIRMFDPIGTPLASKMFLEVWWNGFYDVAAGFDTSIAGTGLNRRASVRNGLE